MTARRNCFQGNLAYEEACCAGEGADCFDLEFTKKLCCNLDWTQASSSIQAKFILSRIHANKLPRFKYRAAFYVKMLALLNISGEVAEVGVHSGQFATIFLQQASAVLGPTAITQYNMIDVWKHASPGTHYDGSINVENGGQSERLRLAINRTRKYWAAISVIQKPSQIAARIFQDEQLSFIYLDARHDYCAVMDELELYWPKLKPGGLFAGDDFYPPEKGINFKYSYCQNGSRILGSVARAIIEWSGRVKLQFHNVDAQWLVHKPMRS